MIDSEARAIAIVGVGAILPDAPSAPTFWKNIREGRYSITEVSPDRWDPAVYWDPDPHAPDKTYSKIGGWVREAEWDPIKWHLPIPPRVAEAMDIGQQWAIAGVREALASYGYPERALDPARTAVILGNAMAGEKHYFTSLRIFAPEYVAALAGSPSFAALPPEVQAAALAEMRAAVGRRIPGITEDTMPGELANCISGRIANAFDFHGPNYVVDAACASAMAAMSAAIEGLVEHDFDAAITGGIDRNMGVSSFVKFCKIGALSATGTRPYAEGADGFVMGEGAAVFLLKRLEDAEHDGDQVIAVIRGVGGASDGRGKGITAPNPVGQKLAIARAWVNAGLSPATAGLVEGHGTSTRVGDAVELESLNAVFSEHDAARGSVALGSVKSNIGHLKAAAGAAGILKAALAIRDGVLPPSLGFSRPNPGFDFARSPFRVNTELMPWNAPKDSVRRAGVSAFGFGGTNFHVVLEEYVPGRLGHGKKLRAAAVPPSLPGPALARASRGVLLIGAATAAELGKKLAAARADAEVGRTPALGQDPKAEDLAAKERVAIDFGDAAELGDKVRKAEKALVAGTLAAWKPLRAQGVFRGSGAPGKVAFLYTGQGSQYAGMMRKLRAEEPIVADVFAEADRVMVPLIGKPLTSIIFPDPKDPAAVAEAEASLMQTAITQPAVLATDIAMTRLLAAHGLVPDLVMGHSLGEYGALVASGALPFPDALEAVSARGREMSSAQVADQGWMAAVSAPLPEVQRILATVSGYVVIANINSTSQCVVGGASKAVEAAMAAFQAAGYNAQRLPVSHAFHTSIVAPASEPLRRVLARLGLTSPAIPVIANVTGEPYPSGPDVREAMLDLLARQVAAPVEFVKGLGTLYAAGARVFVEVGPKKALHGFVDDVLGGKGDVAALFTNHPKLDDRVAFNQALAGLYAAGVGPRHGAESAELRGGGEAVREAPAPQASGPVAVVTGAALGLPGTDRVFGDENLAALLRGDSFIDVVPTRFRRAMLDKHITRLVKGEDGSAGFEALRHPDQVIRLAARAGHFDLAADFGVPEDRLPALDVVTQLAIGAGLDALRDAGIPLVMRYRTTTRGTQLPDRWVLPEPLRDDTGIVFASAFPGYDSFAGDMGRYYKDLARRERLSLLDGLVARAEEAGAPTGLTAEIRREADDVRAEIARHPYVFDRRFLFRVLAMGHSQLAELIGARGPNTQINSACASTTQGVALAEDWIRAGRCRRVLVVSADNVTSDHLLEWMGAGFLVTGAAATDDVVEDAALPFDRRRHGLILGMGASGIVVESPESARERGVGPICELIGSVTANSAFHGTRLDVDHIGGVMETLVAEAEARSGTPRSAMARELVFVSHETYTPARGGSASAEVHALRRVFGADADRIVVANTKGYTGHAMAVGIEDVAAIKMLETGLVPPVANHREVDPELGALNLSRGGAYPLRYALHLGAGFGSQISMSLMRWASPPSGDRPRPDALGHGYRVADPAVYRAWLTRVSGVAAPELEVVQRTLRVKTALPAAKPAPAKPQVAAPVPAPAPRPPLPIAPVVEPLPVAAYAPAPAPAAAPVDEPVKAKVLAIVAEKTGYPSDMLDMDLDLEADLGVDTVKQAETFAAVRAAYDIPREDKLRLRDFPTLNKVVQFVYDHRPDLRAAPPRVLPSVAAPAPAAAPAAGPAIPRRVPVPVVRPALGLCKPTGVALERGRRVVVMLDQGGVGEALLVSLADLGVEVMAIDGPGERANPNPSSRGVSGGFPPTVYGAVDDEAFEQALSDFAGRGPVQGVYWLPALDTEPAIADLDLAGWRAALRVRVKWLARAMRLLYGHVAGAGTFLVSATRLGGCHGYDDAGALAPMGGAVSGFTKAYHREREGALVKVVDFEAACPRETAAARLLAETTGDPGIVEVGYQRGLRWSVGLVERPVADGTAGMVLDKGSVFVVTGAAGSIVAAIVADLAAASGGTFHLLDLAAEPRADDPDVVRYEGGDRDALKRDLFERIKARGERATPAMVEREIAGLERASTALSGIRAVEAAGGVARYHRVDLRDGAAVAAAVAAIRAESGRVDVLLHAAGLEISRSLPDKEQREFDLVFDVKADGWFNLIHALGDTPLGAAVVFSSIAGRFGNGGQTDYSSANDLCCKQVSSLRATRPGTRGIAVDWTAWAGIGMASRGSIPKMMELAGIDMLPAEQGIPWIRRELTQGAFRGEVVVAGRLGVLMRAIDETGGVDPVRLGAPSPGPMIGQVVGMDLYDGLRVETTLDPRAQGFLDHHRIDGVPVLPGVMGIEAFAEAALLCVPGWHVVAVEDVGFAAPFKLYRDEPRTLTLRALPVREGEEIVVECSLSGVRALPGRAAPQNTVHFTGRVRLAPEAPELGTAEVPAPAAGPATSADEIYRAYFHGPAYRVLSSVWSEGDRVVGQMAAGLPDDRAPGSGATVLAPRLIELVFQTAGLRDVIQSGRMALPRQVDRVVTVGAAEDGPLHAVVHATSPGSFDAVVVDGRGVVRARVSGYRTIAAPDDGGATP